MTSPQERSREIMQSIPLIRPIIAFACVSLTTPIILSSVCQTFREAVVDYSGAEVAWRALLRSSTDKRNCQNGVNMVSAFLYHAAKHNWPSWIINSLARAGVVYDAETLKRLQFRPSILAEPGETKKMARRAGNNNSDGGDVADDHDDEAKDDEKGDGSAHDQELTNDQDAANESRLTPDQCQQRKFLLRSGFNLRIDYSEERDDSKNYFHFLAHFGRADCVKTLLDFKSADPFKPTSAGKTSLMLAALAKENSAEIIEMLLMSLATPEARKRYADMQDTCGNQSALCWAVSKKNVPAVEALIRFGNANVECRAKVDADRPLHISALAGDVPMMRTLVGVGKAEVDAKGAIGATPLQLAVLQERMEAVKYLVEEAGANVNAVDDNRSTALHRAVRNCDVEMVKYLLEHGADPSMREAKSGKSVLEISGKIMVVTQKQELARTEIVKLLKDAADVL